MKPAVSIITLGVENLPFMKDFYNNVFGWVPLRDEGIVMYELNGIYLSLYDANALAEDAQVAPEGTGFKKFTLALLCESREDVDATFARLLERGANIVKPAQEVFWGGYSGYVADPENNLWEIAYNPHVAIDAAGNILPTI